MKVLGLWRYPVKSLQGEALDVVEVEEDGVVGDRRWGIRDEATGRILTARRMPALLQASASYDDDGQPVVTLPDGRRLAGPGPDTDRALSEWLARPVSLVDSRGHERGRAEFFADATDDTSEAIEWTMPVGRYVDAAPLLLLTTASLRAAADLHPAGTWDPRRFRPNVLVDVDGTGWVEDGWVGRSLRAGSVTMTPDQPCARCTMVTRPQAGLDSDADVFRTLARHHRGHLGMWTDVAVTGSFRVSDPVHDLTETRPVR